MHDPVQKDKSDPPAPEAWKKESLRWLLKLNRRGKLADVMIAIRRLWKRGDYQSFTHLLATVTVVMNAIEGGLDLGNWRRDWSATMSLPRAAAKLHLQGRFDEAVELVSVYREGHYRISLEMSLATLYGHSSQEARRVMRWVCEVEEVTEQERA